MGGNEGVEWEGGNEGGREGEIMRERERVGNEGGREGEIMRERVGNEGERKRASVSFFLYSAVSLNFN